MNAMQIYRLRFFNGCDEILQYSLQSHNNFSAELVFFVAKTYDRVHSSSQTELF